MQAKFRVSSENNFLYDVHLFYGSIAVGILGLLLVGLFFYRRMSPVDTAPWSAVNPTAQPQFLAITSQMDEAWQVLHYLRSAPIPIAVKLNLFSYLWSALRSDISQRVALAPIYGARSYNDVGRITKLAAALMHLVGLSLLGWAVFMVLQPGQQAADPFSFGGLFAILCVIWFVVALVLTRHLGEEFFSTLLLPIRWFSQRVGSLASIFTAVLTYGMRYWGWSVLLKRAMGLEGYRFALPSIDTFPSNLPEGLVKYETLPESIIQRALYKRSAWISSHLGDVSETFSKLAVSTADVTALLRTIEEDQTLVHAAYSTENECIARIADWIADRVICNKKRSLSIESRRGLRLHIEPHKDRLLSLKWSVVGRLLQLETLEWQSGNASTAHVPKNGQRRKTFSTG